MCLFVGMGAPQACLAEGFQQVLQLIPVDLTIAILDESEGHESCDQVVVSIYHLIELVEDSPSLVANAFFRFGVPVIGVNGLCVAVDKQGV